MDPLLLAHPPTTYSQMSGMTTDEMPFDSYCIVCDRLIVPPKEVEPVEPPKTVKKKMGGGTIRVKNPDGTTTTRSANGQKVTRPGLKRNPNSAARLAALNSSSKMQPLTRSKTNDSVTSPTSESPTNKSVEDLTSPQSNKVVTPRINTSLPAFKSSIYCSKQCMEQDAGKSSAAYANIARTLSYDFSQAFPVETPGVHVHDHSRSPYGPPSPLFVSGSDTESSAASAAGGLLDNSGPASSAPKFMEYFRLSKEGPDEAWNSVQRQRRSSMQPSASQRPSQSTALSQSHVQAHPSNDSLSSLWNGESDYISARSVSSSGKMRAMTSFQIPEREVYGAGKRSVSISSTTEPTAPIPTRAPLRRSDLSQSSLAASPSSVQGVPIPPEFGSAPSHTLDLLQSYAHAFPVRSPSGLSTSVQRGFVFPGSTAMSPNPSESRRSSMTMSRPVSGTIRAKSRNEATWDSFGKEVVDEKNYKSYCKRHGQCPSSYAAPEHSAVPMSVPADFRGRSAVEYACSGAHDTTPKQSLERGVGGWKIKYFQPSSTLLDRSGTIRKDKERSSSRSTSSSGSGSGARSSSRSRGGIAIANANLSTSAASTATSRTPMISRMPPPASVPHRPATTLPPAQAQGGFLPDIAGLKIEAGGCGIESNSVPKSGFNWESSEKKGMKTYEIPDAPKFKLDRNKAGLFYFQ
ncbi:uncharacterized protein I303_108615 [Kwoniella dejecticola CBS 10117]|uniref:Uncharacterized protein n=1 Tax=Kwoniella dejecticola CBS 10117 TaxID=1296121 RepID=A0A1A5ZWW4_9TREE|nr:uncharacterized protein I303_07060 [Kwoniella dejecticola CBS 10117]OBR82301.1 hypothetical protein I303_07060 [Kwoniella dejecticola CBS 10117]